MIAALATLTLLLTAAFGEAQTFRFHLEPLCNKVVFATIQSSSPSVIGIAGYDDNCGLNPRSPIHGTLILHPDGTISIGFTTLLSFSVYGRTDVGLQTSVEWPAGASVGTWRDDDGFDGTFVFEP